MIPIRDVSSGVGWRVLAANSCFTLGWVCLLLSQTQVHGTLFTLLSQFPSHSPSFLPSPQPQRYGSVQHTAERLHTDLPPAAGSSNLSPREQAWFSPSSPQPWSKVSVTVSGKNILFLPMCILQYLCGSWALSPSISSVVVMGAPVWEARAEQ